MYPNISKENLQMLHIYSGEKPEFLLPFFRAKSIQRLVHVGQHCGTEYTKFFQYKFHQSRLEHSVWVALIIWHFTKDTKQTLAGFFHDISHSVFSHVGDYVLGDKINQEASEQFTTKIITEDEVIMKELANLGIEVSEVDDYTKYTIADNAWPKLSADRLEYTLSSGYNLWSHTLDELKEMYDDIIVWVNKEWEKELYFQSKHLAEKFWLLSIRNDESCFSSYESNVSMSFLSEILKYMIDKKYITPMDMYFLGENDCIKIIQNSKDTKLLEMWNFFINVWFYKIDRYKPDTRNYCVSSLTKRRFIDPLVKSGDTLVRVSEVSEIFRKKRDYHIGRQEEWITLAYEM